MEMRSCPRFLEDMTAQLSFPPDIMATDSKLSFPQKARRQIFQIVFEKVDNIVHQGFTVYNLRKVSLDTFIPRLRKLLTDHWNSFPLTVPPPYKDEGQSYLPEQPQRSVTIPLRTILYEIYDIIKWSNLQNRIVDIIGMYRISGKSSIWEYPVSDIIQPNRRISLVYPTLLVSYYVCFSNDKAETRIDVVGYFTGVYETPEQSCWDISDLIKNFTEKLSFNLDVILLQGKDQEQMEIEKIDKNQAEVQNSTKVLSFENRKTPLRLRLDNQETLNRFVGSKTRYLAQDTSKTKRAYRILEQAIGSCPQKGETTTVTHP
ncbi:hypothetical protein G5I_06013 [Acromyrmex echinatior]|uniref:Uncharacterized protein n=1 Tax=Acromyrmex echinatior TaxID=103372 RepID=F4WJX9_ACREC|nr:hypothetical protein G5I_06013 [Acromyrmex echinatior]